MGEMPQLHLLTDNGLIWSTLALSGQQAHPSPDILRTCPQWVLWALGLTMPWDLRGTFQGFTSFAEAVTWTPNCLLHPSSLTWCSSDLDQTCPKLNSSLLISSLLREFLFFFFTFESKNVHYREFENYRKILKLLVVTQFGISYG